MHAEAHDFIARQLWRRGQPASVVEVGARDINGGIRDVMAPYMRYVGIDRQAGRGVDVVADACAYDPPFAPDLVVCCETLEHAPDAFGVLVAMWRWLAEGGELWLTVASPTRVPHSGIDGGDMREGEGYTAISPGLLAAWIGMLPDATVVTIEDAPDRGDLYAAVRKGDPR